MSTSLRERGSSGHSGGEEIEMTVFRDWGRRLPGGGSEVDREDMEKERALFAQFPDDWKTSRDAPERAPLTSELENELREATDRMIARARVMKKKMEDASEPVDLTKIEEDVFGHIPRGMIPPEWVKELQSWRRVRDAMTARAVMRGQAPEGRADKLKNGIDKVSLASDISSALLKGGGKLAETIGQKEIAEVAEKINSAFELLGKAMESAGSGVDIAEGFDSLEGLGQSPVALKIADQKMMEALASLGGLGVDLAGIAIPIIGALKNGADCLAAVKETIERVKLRAATGELREKATVDTTDQLNAAFEQAQDRETRLGVEGALGVTTSALNTTGDVLTLTGVATSGAGAVAGLGIKIVSGVISVGGKVVLAGVDEATAREAVATLRLAQGGNTDAQELVFKQHAHYAKMLIALLAMDENPLAKKYLIDRGLEEADLANPLTTGDLLFDFMVMKSKEEAEPASKIDAAVETIKAAVEKLETFGALCERGLVRIGIITAKPLEAPSVITEAVPSHEQISQLWRQVTSSREKLEEAKESGGAYKDEYNRFTFAMELFFGVQEKCDSLDKRTGAAAASLEKYLADSKALDRTTRAKLTMQARQLRAEEVQWGAALKTILKKGT